MLFPDASCRAENTLKSHFNLGLFEIVKPDWIGIVTLTLTRKIYVDGRLDMAGIGDNEAISLITDNKEMILKDFRPNMCQNGENHFMVIPIRSAPKYVVFYFYLKQRERFKETDFKWLKVYSQLSYQNTLLNNEVAQERDYIENVFDSTESAIIAIDLKGDVVTANNAAAGTFGLKKEDLYGKHYFEYIREENRQDFKETVNKVAATGEKQYIKEMLFSDQNVEKILNMVLSPLRDSKDRVVGVVLVGTDITDRRFMEHEIEQMKQFGILGEIAAGIAHDVKNPLMNIRGCARILGKSSSLDSSQKGMMNIIIHEVDRINEVIEQMLSFGNVTKSNTYKRLNVNDVLVNCIKIIDRQKLDKCIELKCNLDRSIPFIKANNSNIQQVFLNILVNSLQAIEKEGFIEVATSYVLKSCIRITVKDNGRGMDESEMKKIFIPYFTTKTNGTGLGLFISRRVLEQYKASILVESEKGKGTLTTIEFPVKEADDDNGN